MAWNTPLTWDTGRLVTANDLNQQIRDNLLYLKKPPVTRIFPGTVAVTSTTFVPIVETQNIVTQEPGRVLCVAYGHAYVDDGSGAQRFFVHLQQDGNYVIVTNEGIVNGVVNGASFQATPWAVIWLSQLLPAAMHTFRLYGRVTGGTVKFWVNQFWMMEV